MKNNGQDKKPPVAGAPGTPEGAGRGAPGKTMGPGRDEPGSGDAPVEDEGRIAAAVAARVAAEKAATGAKAGSGPEPGTPAEVSPGFVWSCLEANELGDGLLYAAIHKNNFIYNKSSQEWLAWAGHYWERDEMERSLAAVEDVVDRYLEALEKIDKRIAELRGKESEPGGEAADEDNPATPKKQRGRPKNDPALTAALARRKDLVRRCDRLRSEHGRQNCLKFARTNRRPLAITGDRLDQEPMLLACANGVIDLETGKLRPGRQADYLSLASPVAFTGIEAPRKLFRATLLELFEGCEAIVDYLQRLLGYALTGLVSEHIFPVFQGRGRNGKSMLLDLIKEVLGPLAAPIRPELLLEQAKNRSAAAPSPDIMALRGLRLAIAEETDEGSRFSAARVKLLSGGSDLTGRNPHDKYETTFKPTHQLILVTNSRPQAPASDYAFWSRMRLIEFKLSFVDNPIHEHERPRIKDLGKRILEAEAAGILGWLVEGCLLWQRDGLNPPAEVVEATHQYQREEDMVGDFIDECLVIEPGLSVKAATVYQVFVAWYQVTQGRRSPSQKWLGNQLKTRFDKRKSNGIIKYFGFDINWDTASDYTTTGTIDHVRG